MYGLNGAAVELFQSAKAAGLTTVLEQTIAPKTIERARLAAELESFPKIGSAMHMRSRSPIEEREEQEWELADLIVCGSPFVQESLQHLGVGPGKIAVVPYGFDFPGRLAGTYNRRDEKIIRVLFVGEVGLRKGAHRLLLAARALRDEPFAFRLVGPVRLPPAVTRWAGGSAEIIGAVPRSEMPRHYEWADVLVLPSLCEGSAVSTYEAMAFGVPVIASYEAGSLVRDGVDGIIIRLEGADGAEPIVAALRSMREEDRLKRMREALHALESPKPYSYDAYKARLARVIRTAGTS